MADLVQWMKEQSPEKLREIMQGHPKHTDEYRVAELELRRKESEQSKIDSEAAAQIEARRHQEAIALDREAIGESQRANRIALCAIAVALVALVVAILGWMFPREPLARGRSATLPQRLPVPLQSNRVVSVSLPSPTNATSTTAPPVTATPKP
jgi:hypothetical protein